MSSEVGCPDLKQVEELCERVRRLAEEESAGDLDTARDQAAAELAQATRQAMREHEEELIRCRERMGRWSRRELQDCRTAARRRREVAVWDRLSQVLDQAEEKIARMREEDPDRYHRALVQMLRSALVQLGEGPFRARVHPADVGPLRERAVALGLPVEIEEGEIAAGIIAGTAAWDRIVDHAIATRRERLDGELRRRILRIAEGEP